ncbi:alpha-hydroxy acid oxidase [Novosphingobium sp. BL-8H]|uniref:alpha-hydroxy acid oxidase n=1 Tax=Novosphingobium sp. BL-8H TaxID=3127640 RepID=UPI003757727F
MRSLCDYERRAADHFAADAWDHVQSGSDDGLTLADNRAQFGALRFVPRMLQDLSAGSTALNLFGRRHAAPILLAPVAYHRLAHPDGEVASMQAATALDTTMVVSTLSSLPLEQIAEAAREAAAALSRALPPLWFQLYFQPERSHSLELVRRAEAAGYEVLMVTVDAAIKRSEFPLPHGVEAANLAAFPRTTQRTKAAGGSIVFGTPLAAAAPTWADIAWLRAETRLPIVIKGLLSPRDARLAMEHGADGIVVSNHGGRVLDGLVTPLAALPGMVEAVEGRVPLLLDGGVRRGTDVLKALALGASAVMVGRPQLHALAVAGVAGVAHMLHILRAEFELAMAQTGCARLADIDGDLIAVD